MGDDNLKNRFYEMVENFISGAWNIERFDIEFYHYFADMCGKADLTEEEFEFYSEIQQQMDYVAIKPGEIDKEAGIISCSEFRDWIKGHIRRTGFSEIFEEYL